MGKKKALFKSRHTALTALCNLNPNRGEDPKYQRQQQQQQQRQLRSGAAPTSADDGTLQVANPLNNSTTRQRFSSNNNNSGSNNNNRRGDGHQFANRPLLCRTPPPTYNSQPATPPPSYTPRSIDYGPEVLPLPLPHDDNAEAVVVGDIGRVDGCAQAVASGAERRQLALNFENATNRNVGTATATRQAAQQPAQSQNHQQQQQQQRRRRRLHLLQQQQRLSHINATSTDSSNSESEADISAANGVRRQRRLHGTRGIRDAYCPDLLHACSLILHQQQQQTSDDSSVSSFTATPPPAASCYSSTDYVEIDEVRPAAAARSQPIVRYSDRLSNWSSTPELGATFRRSDTATGHGTTNLNAQQRRRVADIDNQRSLETREMGQNLSLRRPRISLTWVLREQQQQSQQQQQSPTESSQQKDDQSAANGAALTEAQNNNNAYINGSVEVKQRTELVPTQLDTTTTATTAKRYRVKQLPGSNDPLNGYATTPTAHTAANAMAPQKFFSNQNLLDYKDKSRAPSRELLFVCTPQRLPKSYDASEALVLAKKRNEIRKRLAAKVAALQANSRAGDGAEAASASALTVPQSKSGGKSAANGSVVLEKDELKTLKGTYSEPSLIAASEGQAHRRHRHRKRRDRNRVQKFGYEISNVDEFLSKCSLSSPGNIPVVLSTSSTLYQTRPGQHQVEIPLPLGMVVNAVFKNQNWLYVQTPHAEEGYVGYACCLPLGILPPAARGNHASTKPTPCWESNGDVFPRPCGNMTDSEKEIRLRGGTRSDGARTPRGKRTDATTHSNDVDTVNGNAAQYGEHHVDKLYLRAASQPRLVEKAYAQLKSTKNATQRVGVGVNAGNDEYVTLQQQKSKLHVQKHLQQQQQLQQLHHKQPANGPYITNGHNGQHLHPKNANVNANATAAPTASSNASQVQSNANVQQNVLHMISRKQHGLRQTLVAIITNYSTDSITLQKGEIVTLCECRESKDHRQWFYVRTRDGREGYIPAEVAGHGYL